jgi:transcriptional regulator with XRE-family HTH domain
MIYSKKLKDIREEKNITQEEISNVLNISRGVYSVYETENQIIPIKHLDVLSNYFNVSIDYLFQFTNIKNYDNSNSINLEISVKRLKEFRKDNKITQVNLAKMLNVANGTIANYECGRNFIATPFLYEICKKYKISADYLLGKVDNPKYINF